MTKNEIDTNHHQVYGQSGVGMDGHSHTVFPNPLRLLVLVDMQDVRIQLILKRNFGLVISTDTIK